MKLKPVFTSKNIFHMLLNINKKCTFAPNFRKYN